jgi:hypothetical protein
MSDQDWELYQDSKFWDIVLKTIEIGLACWTSPSTQVIQSSIRCYIVADDKNMCAINLKNLHLTKKPLIILELHKWKI